VQRKNKVPTNNSDFIRDIAEGRSEKLPTAHKFIKVIKLDCIKSYKVCLKCFLYIANM